MMTLIDALRFARNGLLTQEQTERREDLLFNVKAAKIGAAVIGAISSIHALQALAQGNFSLSLPLAYLNYELWTVADNIEKTLDHPLKEVRLAFAKCKSEEAFVRMIAKGAPLTSEIFACYARYQDAGKAKRAAERPPSCIVSKFKEIKTCAVQKCKGSYSNRP